METNPQSVSSTRKHIAAALVKAQRDFGPALKSSTNPHFRSRYADLSACVEAVVGSLNKNGIALTQHTLNAEGGVSVETVLVHDSGESMSFGTLFVPCSKHDPQGYGSALTYARRYSLTTALGIAPEDDDGNAASAQKTKAAPAARPTPAFHEERPSKAKAKPPVDEDDDRIPF